MDKRELNNDFFHAIFIEDTEKIGSCIELGVDIDATYDNGWKPLLYAVDNETSFKFLIEAGADINISDEDGWTALMYATKKNIDICNILLDKGVFVFPKNDTGNTALDLAKRFEKQDIIDALTLLMTPERELAEHILLNKDIIENEVFNNVRIERMPTINPYYILSDAETNVPIGTFTPNKGLYGLEIYDGLKTLDEAIDNVRDSIDAEVVDNII